MPGQNNASFTNGSLMRHVSVMSFTASIGLMAVFAVDLVDIIFISMLGHEALAAAAGYASTIMLFASAINIGLSIAAGALVSKAIGAGEHEDGREYASSVLVFAVLTGVLVPLLALPNIGFLLKLIGARGAVAEQAASYLWIILPTTMVSGMAMVAVAVLRAHGDGRRAMYPSLAGGVVNAALDPILIFMLSMGLQGAAFATVLARFMTLAVALYPAIRRYEAFSIPRLACVKRDILEATRIAVPAVLSTVATPVGAAIVTREMAKHGSDAVAGIAVINRLVPVVFAVVFALSGAIGPIIGQNFGAGLTHRVRETFLGGLKFTAIYVIGAAGLLFIFRGQIAELFNATDATRSLLFLFCGPLALASFFNGAIYVSNASFNNLGHPGYSTWVNWGRNTIGVWPLAIIGSAYWGAPGVLIGQALGGVIFAAIAIWLSLRVIENPQDSVVQPYFRFRQQRMQVLCGRCNR